MIKNKQKNIKQLLLGTLYVGMGLMVGSVLYYLSLVVVAINEDNSNFPGGPILIFLVLILVFAGSLI